MRDAGGTTALLRAPANQVSPRAVPYWTITALLGDAVLLGVALALSGAGRFSVDGALVERRRARRRRAQATGDQARSSGAVPA